MRTREHACPCVDLRRSERLRSLVTGTNHGVVLAQTLACQIYDTYAFQIAERNDMFQRYPTPAEVLRAQASEWLPKAFLAHLVRRAIQNAREYVKVLEHAQKRASNRARAVHNATNAKVKAAMATPEEQAAYISSVILPGTDVLVRRTHAQHGAEAVQSHVACVSRDVLPSAHLSFCRV